MLKRLAAQVMWLGVAAVLALIASGIADFVQRPCINPARGAQTAAVGGVFAQNDEYYETFDANGNPVEEALYYEEPCYEYEYEEPAYFGYDEYYYEPDYSTGYYDYSYSFVPSYYGNSGGYVQSQIVPVGVPTQGTVQYTSAPASYVQTPSQSVTVTSPSFTVVPIGVPTGGVTAVTETPAAPTKPVQITVVPPTVTVPTAYPPTQYYLNPLPSCAISAYPFAPAAGENVTIAWYSTNAIYAYLSDFGTVSTNGSIVLPQTSSRVFTLTVRDSLGRTASCASQLSVLAEPRYRAPTCYISSDVDQVRAGDPVRVTWASTGATSAALNVIGAVGTAGSYQFIPTANTVYMLSVSGPGGSSACSAQVSVSPAPTPAPTPKPTAKLAPSCNIAVSHAAIFAGDSTDISWSSSRSSEVTISGVGTVGTSGTTQIAPTSTQTYVMTAIGEGGTRSCSVTVEVKSKSACTITCDGVTYECAPVGTPVAAVCPSESNGSVEQSQKSGLQSFWQWLIRIF